MTNLTPAEVLAIFVPGTKDLDILAFKAKQKQDLISVVADLDLSSDEQETLSEYLRMKDKLYQHLSRHSGFGEKESDGTWLIPQENLSQIAHWAIKAANKKRINKNLMLTSKIVDRLSELPRGQMSTVVDFAVELLFSVTKGKNSDIKIAAKKLRLYCKLSGAGDIDKRLKQLVK